MRSHLGLVCENNEDSTCHLGSHAAPGQPEARSVSAIADGNISVGVFEIVSPHTAVAADTRIPVADGEGDGG